VLGGDLDLVRRDAEERLTVDDEPRHGADTMRPS
jgi:hypothetical protein